MGRVEFFDEFVNAGFVGGDVVDADGVVFLCEAADDGLASVVGRSVDAVMKIGVRIREEGLTCLERSLSQLLFAWT